MSSVRPTVKPHDSKTTDKMNTSPTKSNAPQSAPRKKVVLLGDSHYNQIDETLLRRKHYVQVRNHPGATSTDLLDHLKRVLRSSPPPDHIIYHGACNDLKHDDIDTLANLQELVKIIREKSPNTKLTISLLLPRNDEPNINAKVIEMNHKIKTFCKANKIDVLSNSNVRLEHLGKKQVHLKGEGLKIFAGNIASYIRKLT